MASAIKFAFSARAKRVDDALSSDELVDGGWTKLDHPSSTSSSNMPPTISYRRPSTASNLSSAPTLDPKGKDRSLLRTDSDPFGFGHRLGHNTDNFDSKSSESSPSVTAYASSSHSAPLHQNFQQHSAPLPSKHRLSILSAASDAFGFRKKVTSAARRKPNNSLSHKSTLVPEVIEINNTTITSTIGGATAHKDHEVEERERLRDVAAQSIGLDPELLHSSKSDSRPFLDSPQSPLPSAPMPPFPATLVALLPFTELSATLPKFTPPSSLLVYALAKQWKSRTIVLTSHSPSQKTHVHLFKGASKDEKEVERLEVTEDSVIYVAEEHVGGRGNVVKFAGKDVYSKQTGEGSSRAMWFLQIKDPVESHRWIAAIKNAVLTQRAVRAGVDVTAHLDRGNEPKGDMDVMLSMHLQRITSPHSINTSSTMSPRSPVIPISPSPPLSQDTSSSPSSAVITKGIVSGTRPGSPSVEGSPTPGHVEDSFSAAGSSRLLTMLRTKSSTDSNFSPSHTLPLLPSHVSVQGSPAPSLRSTSTPVVITAADLKISKERDAVELSASNPEASSSSTTPGASTPPAPSFTPQGSLTFSLQPPPRKPKHAVAAIPSTVLLEPQGMYKQATGNRSVAGNFGILSRNSGDVTPKETPPTSPDTQPGSFSPSSPSSGCEMPSSVADVHVMEQSDAVTRTLSGNEVNSSSLGSGSLPPDKLLQSTAITKRWSRQGTLPKQLTPPSGPPPCIPPSPENNHRISVESGVSATHTADCSSCSSSNFHSQTRIRPRSGSSLSPTFWKRTSSSSAYSGSSANTFDSQSRPLMRLPFGGEYFSSSLGSVTGNGGTSRPISLSVHGSSPVVHIGTAKRRSMPPPRPAPNFAPPPAPTIEESSGTAPLTTPAPTPQKSFRSSVAQRALRLSLTSPKPPPSSALPPRPDEATFVQGHRRSSSSGRSDIRPAPSSRPTSYLCRDSNSIQHSPPPKSLSIRQRLRILSTPPAQSSLSSIPSIQVSTLDLSDDNDDDLPTPSFTTPQSFGLGEHIMTMQSDPSFLQLSSPITPTIPKPPSRSPFGPNSPLLGAVNGLRTPPLKHDCDFVSLSPPPPRKICKSYGVRPETIERSASEEREESKLVALSQRGSVVSLGFVST